MKTTRDRLIELGKKGDTYDDIINRVIDELVTKNIQELVDKNKHKARIENVEKETCKC